MARYIDADTLQRRICGAKCGCEYEECGCEGDCAFEHFIFNAPTADVAPRAEIAREIIEDVATLIEAHWSEIQHGVYWLVCGRCIPLRELLKTVEKKYTEGQK